jgi:uncharacterized protein
MHPDNPLKIIGFVNNLLFNSRIEDKAEKLGFQMIWISQATELGPDDLDEDIPARQFGEPMVGRGVILIEKITRVQPALIIFDLGNEQIPWRSWLPLIKSVPSTRRLPVVCFGAHVDTDSIIKARECGADGVFSRSRFMSGLTDILQKYAIVQDKKGLARACDEFLSSHAIKGLELFNSCDYFEAHEELELAWKEDHTIGRDLYRAVLQVAVAYLQIERGNFRGAYKMFLRVRQWLEPLPDICRGINVGKLRSDSNRVYKALIELGPDRIIEFNLELLRPVEYVV